jgi:TPR repeat protein
MDTSKATYLFLSAAKDGMGSAQFNHAMCCARGQGRTQNDIRAVKYMVKAATAGLYK